MAAPEEIDALYRAAVSVALDLPDQAPAVRDIARALRKLAPVLRDRPRAGRVRVELTFEDDTLRKIEPCALGGRVWAELD